MKISNLCPFHNTEILSFDVDEKFVRYFCECEISCNKDIKDLSIHIVNNPKDMFFTFEYADNIIHHKTYRFHYEFTTFEDFKLTCDKIKDNLEFI